MLADWFNEPAETAVNKVEEFEKEVEEEVHRRAGADEAADRRGQAADRLRRAARHLSLHRQADAGPRPVSGDLPREPARRRRQGIRLHHRLQGPVQEPRRRRSTTTPRGPSTATTRRTWPACWKIGWGRPASGWRRPGKPCKALCEPVEAAAGHGGLSPLLLRARVRQRRQLKDNEPKRLALYKHVGGLRARLRQPRQRDAGGRLFAGRRSRRIKAEVEHYEKVRNEVKLASGDYIDLKMYEPAMRHLIDTYIRAEESEKTLGVRRPVAGPADRRARRGCHRRPAGGHPEQPGGRGRDDREQRPEAHHRRAADQPEILRADVGAARCPDRAAEAGGHRLPEVSRGDRGAGEAGGKPDDRASLSEVARHPGQAGAVRQPGQDEALALAVHGAVRANRQDDWRSNPFKVKKVKLAIKAVLGWRRLPGRAGLAAREEPA